MRDSIRDWLARQWDPDLSLRDWWARLAGSGWAAPHWPEAWFGRGLPPSAVSVVATELLRIGAPGPPAGLGLWLAGPTILAHGTDGQRRRFLPRILDGTEAWCQLFSEPGAGSDLASLTTAAVGDGDGFVVTGAKVWSSGAHQADLGMLLARTDPAVPRHGGISYLVIDMDQPGVTVRPLRQLTGRSHFNEVFLDGARVPAGRVLGGLGNGWAVAQTTLAAERNVVGGPTAAVGVAGERGGFLDRRAGDVEPGSGQQPAIAQAGAILLAGRVLQRVARDRGLADDPVVRQVLARVYTDGQLARFTALRLRAGDRGPAAATLKLAMAEAARRAREAAFTVLGADGMVVSDLQEQALASLALSIAGGTDEIQRNVLGERILGLPREPAS